MWRKRTTTGSRKGIRMALLTLTLLPIGIALIWVVNQFSDLFR